MNFNVGASVGACIESDGTQLGSRARLRTNAAAPLSVSFGAMQAYAQQ